MDVVRVSRHFSGGQPDVSRQDQARVTVEHFLRRVLEQDVERVAKRAVHHGSRLVSPHDFPAAGPNQVDQLPGHVVAGVVIEMPEGPAFAETRIGTMIIIQHHRERRDGDAHIRMGQRELPQPPANFAVRTEAITSLLIQRGQEGNRSASLRRNLTGASHVAHEERPLKKAHGMSVIRPAVLAPDLPLRVVRDARSVPGGEVDEPGPGVLTGGAPGERDVPLVAIDVLAYLAAKLVKAKLGGVMVPGEVAIHGCPGMMQPRRCIVASETPRLRASTRRGS